MSHSPLFDTLDVMPGIGPRKVRRLKKLGLERIIDAIFYFPRGYEDHSEILKIAELRDGDSASVIGEIADFELVEKGAGRSTFYLLVQQGNQFLRAVWFNQPYRASQAGMGKLVMLSGKVKLAGMRAEMVHPQLVILDPDDVPDGGTLLPTYGLTEGIKQPELRRLIRSIVDRFAQDVDEVLPAEFRESRNLIGIETALRQIHCPQSREQVDVARRRFVYQELLTLQLAVTLRRAKVTQQERAPEFPRDSRVDSRIKNLFPFQLTNEQQRAMTEVANDMSRPVPMNRLLHGEVGSGKTCVAIYALMLAVAKGHQGVLMAPTETLAKQHFRNLQQLLAGTRVQVGLFSGSLPAAEKRKVLAEIQSGDIGIIVGTQALIQNSVVFDKLGVVIVDEQHRFGVKQRAGLRQPEVTPHYLVMTATPIPRSVSMTLFGDLDVSRISELPPNRVPINTYLCQSHQKEKWWEFVRKKLREGRQAYVIAPLVEARELSGDGESATHPSATHESGPHESEPNDSEQVQSLRQANAPSPSLDDVESTFENLANGELADFRVDLLHGRQTSEEKEIALRRFAEGSTQVLVATTVVEVGIDVPNATLMTILSASRFGLAQLHQLRGRVGRGQHAGFFGMFTDDDSEEVAERLQHLVDIQNGFELAEVDFRLRGPGDLFSTRQHGLPPLFVADLQKDSELLLAARKDAQEILESDPEMKSAPLEQLRKRVLARYANSLDLSDVG